MWRSGCARLSYLKSCSNKQVTSSTKFTHQNLQRTAGCHNKTWSRNYHILSTSTTASFLPTSPKNGNKCLTGAAAAGCFHSTAGHKRRVFYDLPDVFDRVRLLMNAEAVARVNATFIFDIYGEGRFFIDLTEGNGQIGYGNIPNKPQNFQPDVHIKISKDNCLKVFNNELQPATAFMTGKFELVGDMTKVLSLEGIFKASRMEKAAAAEAASETEFA